MVAGAVGVAGVVTVSGEVVVAVWLAGGGAIAGVVGVVVAGGGVVAVSVADMVAGVESLNASTEGKMRLNIPLIRRVRRWILIHPTEYNQTGCRRCIGALAYFLGRNIPKEEWDAEAIRLIGKDGADGLLGLPDGHSLFVAHPDEYWPRPFASQWEKAQTRRERARIATRRLDYLLKTGR